MHEKANQGFGVKNYKRNINQNCYSIVNHDYIMTPWQRNIIHIMGPLWGKSTGGYWTFVSYCTHHGGFLSQSTSNFYIFFVVSFSNLLNKQSSWWWFDRSYCSCDVTVMMTVIRGTIFLVLWDQSDCEFCSIRSCYVTEKYNTSLHAAQQWYMSNISLTSDSQK